MAERFILDRQVFDEQTERNMAIAARRTQKEVKDVAANLAQLIVDLVNETLDEFMDAIDAELQIFQDTEYPAACRLYISGNNVRVEETTSQEVIEQTVHEVISAVRSQYNSGMAA